MNWDYPPERMDELKNILRGLKEKDYEGDEERQAEIQAMLDAIECPISDAMECDEKTEKLVAAYDKIGALLDKETRRSAKRTRELNEEARRLEEAHRLKKLKKSRSIARGA